jgi:hypothetical protein
VAPSHLPALTVLSAHTPHSTLRPLCPWQRSCRREAHHKLAASCCLPALLPIRCTTASHQHHHHQSLFHCFTSHHLQCPESIASPRRQLSACPLPTGLPRSQEEQQKLAARAERFGLQSQGLQYITPAVPEDEAKKKARTEPFGVEYQPTDETGLMDVCKPRPHSPGGLGFRAFQGVSLWVGGRVGGCVRACACVRGIGGGGCLGMVSPWLRPYLLVWPLF